MNKSSVEGSVSLDYIRLHLNKPTSKTLWVLKGLLDGEEISSIIAFEKYKSMSLAAIISKFKKELNIPIEPNIQKTINSEGRVVNYAKYRITPSLLKKERERFDLN